MKTKKFTIVTVFVLMLSFCTAIAQNNLGKVNDLGRIALQPYIAEQVENIPSLAEHVLLNKLGQIVNQNNLSSTRLGSRFIITPQVTVLTKDITATAPPMIALNLEVTLYVGDGIEGIKFSQISLPVKGVGTNESKAFLNALNRINPQNPVIQRFIERSKNKIISYYNTNCDFILKEALSLEAQHKYKEAIYKLVTIPQVCKKCYDKSLSAVGPVYQKYIDQQGAILLMRAKNAWNAGQDFEAAKLAAGFLAQIEPESSSFYGAKQLSNEIAKRMKALDQRNWDFMLKTTQNAVDIKLARINAAREVGTAYGNHQPQNVTYNTRGWW